MGYSLYNKLVHVKCYRTPISVLREGSWIELARATSHNTKNKVLVITGEDNIISSCCTGVGHTWF